MISGDYAKIIFWKKIAQIIDYQLDIVLMFTRLFYW